MGKKKTESESNVVDLEVVRQKKESGDETLLLELYSPNAIKLQDDDWIIRACDGETEYVWLATRKKKLYRVVEVYPGKARKRTFIRDLNVHGLEVSGRFDHISKVLEYIDGLITDDLEFENDGTNDAE